MLKAVAVGLAGLLLTSSTLLLLPSAGSNEWLRRPLHDDAYYFLIVARSVAHGEGATVNGTWVNGFQPLHLATCLLAGWLSGWDVVRTPAWIAWIGWILHNVVGPGLLLALGRRGRWSPAAVGFCMLVWLFHPYGQRAPLNGMETSLSLLAWLLVGVVWSGRRTAGSSALGLGLALGIAFWARNDAVVLSVACGILTLTGMRADDMTARRATLVPLLKTAVVVCAVALPWLCFNLLVSGSWVPQSGLAERAGGLYDFGRILQAAESLPALVRNLSPVPFPLSRIEWPARAALSLPLLAIVAALGRWVWRRDAGVRDLGLFYLCAVGLLWIIYAVVFGAPHMLTRWLAPAIVLSVLFTGHLLAALWGARGIRRLLAASAMGLIIAGRFSTAVADARLPQPTNTWQMLRYVRSAPGVRTVGSFQSGLLAWALPSVVNLDGKVDAAALKAFREGTLAEWIAASHVDLIVDQDLLGYEVHPVILKHFIVERPEPGLIVLRRKP